MALASEQTLWVWPLVPNRSHRPRSTGPETFAPHPPLIGQTLAHYRITAAIGAGGTGEVYRATDTKLGREVALKVLPAEMASHPERLERFQREAKALAALDHPAIVTVHSVEESGGVHFLTMQLVEGQPLDERIPEGGMPVAQLVAVGTALADALAAAHGKGIVHRDLKPANVMLTPDGRVKLLDFGLARTSGGPADAPGGSELPTDMRTREGVVMGTVPYLSPEQLQGRAVDGRADIFSLGVVLYEMATGRRPFRADGAAALIMGAVRCLKETVLPILIRIASMGPMKTTVEIPDALLERARLHARRSGRPVRALIEEGLRLVLQAGSASVDYRLPDRSVGVPGAPNPLEAMSWQDLRDEVYGGR